MYLVIHSRCVVCHGPGATGYWSLCPACRRDLADRSARRRAAMVTTHCMGCRVIFHRRPSPGYLYCPGCQKRFAGQAARTPTSDSGALEPETGQTMSGAAGTLLRPRRETERGGGGVKPGRIMAGRG